MRVFEVIVVLAAFFSMISCGAAPVCELNLMRFDKETTERLAVMLEAEGVHYGYSDSGVLCVPVKEKNKTSSIMASFLEVYFSPMNSVSIDEAIKERVVAALNKKGIKVSERMMGGVVYIVWENGSPDVVNGVIDSEYEKYMNEK